MTRLSLTLAILMTLISSLLLYPSPAHAPLTYEARTVGCNTPIALWDKGITDYWGIK